LQFFQIHFGKTLLYSLYIVYFNGFLGGRCQFCEEIDKIHHLAKIEDAQKVCKNAQKFAKVGQKFTKMRAF